MGAAMSVWGTTLVDVGAEACWGGMLFLIIPLPIAFAIIMRPDWFRLVFGGCGRIIAAMIELRGNGSMGFCDGMNRRAMLRIGGLAPLGLSLSSLLGASGESQGNFGHAKR